MEMIKREKYACRLQLSVTVKRGLGTGCGHNNRDQLNSRFHGRDIFREIGLLP